LGSDENQDTEISKFIDEDDQLLNIQHLTGDDVLSADVQHIGEMKIETKYKNEY